MIVVEVAVALRPNVPSILELHEKRRVMADIGNRHGPSIAPYLFVDFKGRLRHMQKWCKVVRPAKRIAIRGQHAAIMIGKLYV